MSASKVDLKVVMLGRAHVGKSCLVDRFLHDRWNGDQAPTIGAHFGARTLPTGDGKTFLTLGLWDTAGSERFESMTRHYYKGADGAVICYDLTDSLSWDKVKFWVREVTTIEENCIIAIVGTKADLIISGARGRAVPKEATQAYAQAIGARYYETSSLTGSDAQLPFLEIVQIFNKRPRKVGVGSTNLNNGIVDLNLDRNNNANGTASDKPNRRNGNSNNGVSGSGACQC